MEKDNDLLEGQTDSEEDLFDLSLNDLSPEDLEQEPAKEDTDEDIIELMELVEKGEKELSGDYGEDVPVIEDDQPTEKQIEDDADEISEEESALSKSDLDLSDMSLEADLNLLDEEDTDTEETAPESDELLVNEELEEETDQEMNMTINSPIEADEGSLDDLIGEMDEDKTLEYDTEEPEDNKDGDVDEADFDTILDEKIEDDMNTTIQAPLDAPEGSEPEDEAAMEEPGETQGEVAIEEPDETQMEEDSSAEDSGDEVIQDKDITPEEFEEKDTESSGETAIGISEEKIEEIVTRVVGDVVERVVRETMADVAEKVIREAIDALKQSLEDDSEEKNL